MRRILGGAGLFAGLFLNDAYGQQPAVKLLVISPLVSEVVDQQEKATYGLFPYHSADSFKEARVEQQLSPDSTLQLRVLLRNGRTVLRPFTRAELAAVRTSIGARQQELTSRSAAVPPQRMLAVGQLRFDRRFRVKLRSGATFDGFLVDRYPQQLSFLVDDSVQVVDRTAIVLLETVNSQLYPRPKDRFAIGNGDRLFLTPTARTLGRNEKYLQAISPFIFGGGYGVTRNFSIGLVFSAIPVLPLKSQFLIFTPKLSAQVAEKWRVGGGVMYVRVPDFGSKSKPYGFSLGYGLATYGSADNNFTVGAGYGLAGANGQGAAAIQFGGQKRVNRRFSLLMENYFLPKESIGLVGLYGTKLNWRRSSLSLGALYALPFTEFEYAFTTVVPLYYEYCYRFGNASPKKKPTEQ